MVAIGEMVVEPPVTGETEPTPLSILNETASSEDHVSVAEPPEWMLVELTESEQDGTLSVC
ncbi:hypothetical protein CO131_01855 [Candidatus Kaiserbacteria bacterium CG_4_9_14_3_um_filter_50_16]|nr:MAG: hypothetical protein CO131_01855 [Candidatus Kaiserbacteria bacterium CG_4_9_14_3_um_filter_50_16]